MEFHFKVQHVQGVCWSLLISACVVISTVTFFTVQVCGEAGRRLAKAGGAGSKFFNLICVDSDLSQQT